MKLILRLAYYLFHYFIRGFNKYFLMQFKNAACKKCGKNVYIGTGVDIMSYKNLSLGNNVSIGKNSMFL